MTGRVSLMRGYVLRHRPWRDTSMLIEGFTADAGRMGLVARGVRRRGSRTRAMLEPFQPLLLSWSGRGELRTLAAVETGGGLPRLAGPPPLGGDILSHDQVEAALMRRAGYEVRVLADEDDSFEDNPPSLPDFIKRELRWCHGNLQYLRLLRLPGLKPVSRVQLALAILMYVSAPAWLAFIGLGTLLAGQSTQFAGVPLGYGVAFFALVMTLNLVPKLMGLAQVLLRPGAAAPYGGRARVVAGGLAELVVSMLIAPVVAFSIAAGIVRLSLGRRMTWAAQTRHRARGLSWRAGARGFWPHTLTGLAFGLYLGCAAPWALWFAAPVIGALVLSIPVAVVTTRPGPGAWSRRVGLFAIPEETAPARDAPEAAVLNAA